MKASGQNGEVKKEVEQVDDYVVTSAESSKTEVPIDLTLENVGEEDPFVHDLLEEIDDEIKDEVIAKEEDTKHMLEIVESSTDHWDQELNGLDFNKVEEEEEPKIEEIVPEKPPVIKSPPPMASFY